MMPPVFSLENIHRQYMNCRRNKRNTINALKFEYRLEENLKSLHDELEGQTYTPSRSVCFVVNQPKMREIFAADFRDRVIHHILVDTLEKIWEPRFIYDSYACRIGKGTHGAVKRLQGFMRQVTCNGTRRAYFIHMDIKGFFLHINKEILYEDVKKWVRDAKILWLARTVIFHDCTKNMSIKGNKGLLKNIPSHKTLFNTENKRGLPIGNLTSQFFANVYLNELDQFVKHQLKAGYYIRYCDDFVLLHAERERLLRWKEEIKEFLQSRLRLDLNEQRQAIGQVSDGTDFLGYIVRPDYLLVRRRVVNALKARLAKYQKILIHDKRDYMVLRYEPVVLERLRGIWASYMAHLKMANTHRLKQRLLERFEWMGHFFLFHDEKLKRMDEVPVRLQTIKGQYRFFLGRASDALMFFQVGRYFEFYDKQAEAVMKVLDLKEMEHRRGFHMRCGFPVSLKQRYISRLMKLGLHVQVIKEEGDWGFKVKKRRIAEAWIPKSAGSVIAA